MQRTIRTLLLPLCVAFAVRGAEGIFRPIGMGGGGAILAPVVSPYDPKFMLITTDMGGGYRSENGGESWELIHFNQLRGGDGSRAVILKDEIYWQGGVIFKPPVLKVSRDKGRTWTPTADKFPWSPDAIKILEAAGGAAPVLFAGNAKGCWRSNDHGATWTPVAPEGSAGSACQALLALDDRVLAAFDAKLFESLDQGRTWAALAIPAAQNKPLLSLAGGRSAATKETVLYAIASDVGTLQSRDEGKTWAVVQPWNKQNDIQMAANQIDVAYSAQTASAGSDLFRTQDKGKTWEKVFPPDASGSRLDWTQAEMHWGYLFMINGLYASRSDPALVMASSIGDAYVSRDSGKTWTPLTTANSDLPAQEGNPYRRWKTNGLQVTGCFSLHADPNDKKRVFAGNSDIGLIRSIDGGETWSTLSEHGSPWTNSYYDLAFDPLVKNRIYAAASNTHDIPDWRLIDDLPKETGGVVVSDDGGNTWRKLWALSPEKVVTSICADAKASKDKDHVVLYIAVYDDGVYKSTDSGKTWARKSNGLGYPGNTRVHRVRIQPETGDLFAVGIGRKHDRDFPVPGGLWKSADGGETWTDLIAALKLKWPAGYVAFHPKDPNTILLSASGGPGFYEQGGVWKTADGGKTWKQTLTGDVAGKYCSPETIMSWDVSFNAAHPNVAYFGTTFHGLWITEDSGDTWKPYKEFPSGSAHSTQADPLDPERVIVSTFGGGLWRGPAVPPK